MSEKTDPCTNHRLGRCWEPDKDGSVVPTVAWCDACGRVARAEAQRVESRCPSIDGVRWLVRDREYRLAKAWDRVRAAEEHVDALLEDLAAREKQAHALTMALTNCVMAMRLWGAQEDGVPEDGPIGSAFDAASKTIALAAETLALGSKSRR